MRLNNTLYVHWLYMYCNYLCVLFNVYKHILFSVTHFILILCMNLLSFTTFCICLPELFIFFCIAY
jgi:hypothetical protein